MYFCFHNKLHHYLGPYAKKETRWLLLQTLQIFYISCTHYITNQKHTTKVHSLCPLTRLTYLYIYISTVLCYCIYTNA